VSFVPVFVVSTGRAGSKMIAEAMRVHPQVVALHEPLPRPGLHREAYWAWSGRADARWLRTRLERKRRTLVEQILANGFVYLESAHYCSHLIGPLRDLFPGAKFVFLHRDGREFVRSGLERSWYRGKEESALAHLVKFARDRLLLDLGNVGWDHRLSPPKQLRTRAERIAWLWAEINRSIEKGLAGVPQQDQFRLPLAELSIDSLRALTEFMGIDGDPRILSKMMAVAAERPNKTRSRSVPPFEQWTRQEQLQFFRIAGPMMKQLGYPSSLPDETGARTASRDSPGPSAAEARALVE
jgi:hypothetical protein